MWDFQQIETTSLLIANNDCQRRDKDEVSSDAGTDTDTSNSSNSDSDWDKENGEEAVAQKMLMLMTVMMKFYNIAVHQHIIVVINTDLHWPPQHNCRSKAEQ